MPAWSVEDHLQVDLEDVREASIKIVGGDVSVTTAPGPARLEVRSLRGGPVDVHHEMGALRIFHPEWAYSGLRRLWEGLTVSPKLSVGNFRISGGLRGPEAAVALTVPPETKVEVSAVSASVVVAGVAKLVRVVSVSGDLTLKDLREGVDAKTVSGDINARGMHGDLKLKTVSGEISVADGACRWLDVKTVSGDVTLDLDPDPAGIYDVVTVSGEVAMRLPADPSILVEAASLSGRLESDFDLHWDDHRAGRKRVRGRIGGGDARLFIKTLSGDLRVLRRREIAA